MTNISTLFSVVLQFLVSNRTRDFFRKLDPSSWSATAFSSSTHIDNCISLMSGATPANRPPRPPALGRFALVWHCPTVPPGPQPPSSLLFHVGQPKQAGGTALEGTGDTAAMPRWPFWFGMKPCSVWVGPSKSLGRHLEALQEHPRGSQTKPHANEFGETLLVAAYNGEVFRAAKCPQEFSARLHPRSSSLLQRVAADLGLK